MRSSQQEVLAKSLQLQERKRFLSDSFGTQGGKHTGRCCGTQQVLRECALQKLLT